MREQRKQHSTTKFTNSQWPRAYLTKLLSTQVLCTSEVRLHPPARLPDCQKQHPMGTLSWSPVVLRWAACTIKPRQHVHITKPIICGLTCIAQMFIFYTSNAAIQNYPSIQQCSRVSGACTHFRDSSNFPLLRLLSKMFRACVHYSTRKPIKFDTINQHP